MVLAIVMGFSTTVSVNFSYFISMFYFELENLDIRTFENAENNR